MAIRVDDNVYNQLKWLYWGDEAKASKAKGQLESYTQEKYDQYVSNLSNLYTKQNSSSTSSNTTKTSTSSTPKTTTTTTQATNGNLGNWNYGNDSAERQQEIINNLNNAYSKNPTQFSSWDTFANAFNYNYSGRSDTERETMRNWYEQKFWTTQTQAPSTTRTQTDAVYDKNGNLHISYSDGSTQIIPWNTQTQQWYVWGATWLSADGKTYTFQPWYEPIYPQGETVWDKSTSVANLWKLQQKSKTLSYQEDTQERYNQILDNLEKIYVTNPEYYTDRTTFDANFQIDQRSIGQQQLMVEWFYAKKKKEKDYDAISGLNNWQAIYDAINNGNLTYDQLDLLKWTPQYNDYLSITQDKVNLATINNDPSMFFINSMPKTLEELRAEIMATIGEMDEYNMWEYMLSLYDGEDYERVRDRVEKSTQEALLVKAEYDSIDSNVRNRLEWTGATKAYINAVIAREQNDLIPRVNTAYAQLQADQTNYQLRHQSVEDKYKSYYDQAHYEIQKYNAQINAFQTMWGTYRDVAQYDWDYKQQVRLTELQEKYNNPMLDSDDPDEAKRALKQALQSYYDVYWQIIQRDINQVMQDVYDYAKKNNVSLATALQKNFVDQLKKKPEYKELTKQFMYGREYLYQKAWTAWSSSSKSEKSSTTAWTWWVTPSASWWEQSYNSEPTLADYETVKSTLNSFITTSGYTEWNTWGQCGHYVNQYLNELWFWLGNIKDSLEDKVALINDDTPEIWSILVMESSKAPENWHVAIVLGVNPANWNLIVQDSNRKSDWIIRVHELSPTANANKIRGYINPAKAIAYNNYNGAIPNSEFVWESWITHKLNKNWFIDALTPNYKYYNEKWEIASTASESQALLSDYWISREQFVAQAKNYATYWPEAQSYVNDVMEQKKLVTYLLENLDEVALQDFIAWNGTERVANLNYLVNQQTLDYFVKLKQNGATFGAMSEWEWEIIWKASTKLSYYLNHSLSSGTIVKSKEAIGNILREMDDNFTKVLLNTPAFDKSPYIKQIQNSNNWGAWGTNASNSTGGANNTGNTDDTYNASDSGRWSDR